MKETISNIQQTVAVENLATTLSLLVSITQGTIWQIQTEDFLKEYTACERNIFYDTVFQINVRKQELVSNIRDLCKQILSAPSLTLATINTNIKIYFSYAWGDDKERKGKSREKIVNDLYDSLATDGYKLVRDKVDLGYKGYISDFMQEIGKGDIIIVAVSQKYAKSPFCMFELYEIARNCGFDKYKFRDKVVPIMVEFVDFAKPKILTKYFEYWKKQNIEWEIFMKEHMQTVSPEQFDRYNKTKLISQHFGILADWLVDMNTLNPKLLSADNFVIIKAEIEKFGK